MEDVIGYADKLFSQKHFILLLKHFILLLKYFLITLSPFILGLLIISYGFYNIFRPFKVYKKFGFILIFIGILIICTRVFITNFV